MREKLNIRISILAIKLSRFAGKLKPLLFSFTFVASISGCATINEWFGSSGPSAGQVQEKRDDMSLGGIQLVDVNGAVAHKLVSSRKQSLFSESFRRTAQSGSVIGAGDVIELSVWEAPPAMLFGGMSTDPATGASTTRVTFPEQMVSSGGAINIPFAGQIPVAGRTPQQIEVEIASRLKDKANQPQVLVRVIQNNTANVTVVGEVASSARVPLTARGERLLDALAAAGGVRQPVDKMTLQLTRGDQVHALALDTIIRDPKQNIVLQPGDVITALFQPLSFTVLGATGKNEEVNFEAQGISLAQALGRAGGLQDDRADASAVFIFRFEDGKALDWATPPKTTPDGKVPVIYQVNLKDPASFLVAQSFPVDNKDVLYVSNAPAAEFQKFLQMLTQTFFILRTIGTFAF
jgi:polysaccharide export outer membrane protein